MEQHSPIPNKMYWASGHVTKQLPGGGAIKRKAVRRKSGPVQELEKNKTEKQADNVMDMKRVRYEVFKFGMSGFKPEKKKEEVKIALAVKLGAKPPRNKCYNYKEYKHMKEEEAKERLERKKMLAAEKAKIGKPNSKKKKLVDVKGKTKRDGILGPYGRPGKVYTSSKLKVR